jgi:hypothetical protein
VTTRYRYSTTLSFGSDGEPNYSEVDVTVSYTVAWGSPESGAGYMADPYRYDPGSPDVVEDIRLELVEGKPRPWGMGCGYISDDEFAEMVAERLEDDEPALLQEARDREAAWAE